MADPATSARGVAHVELAALLHDSVIQRLVAVGLHLESMIACDTGQPGAYRQMVRCIEVLGDALGDLRSVVADLSAHSVAPHAEIDGRLVCPMRSVAQVIDEMMLALGFAPCFRCDVDLMVPPDLDREIAMVVREALANVARHAEATTVVVAIGQRSETLTVQIADDGRWCPRPERSGHGLTSMGRRASARGGSVSVSTSPSGTDVTWCVPLVR